MSTMCGGTRTCKRDIARAGAAKRIFGFHVCDWLVPTQDVLNDRGMMGDGVIDVPSIRQHVEAAGYAGARRGRDLLGPELVDTADGRDAGGMPRAPRLIHLNSVAPAASHP